MPGGLAPLERFVLRAGVIAAVTVAGALGLVAIGVSLSEGFWRTLVLTIATAILAIGGISFVYETYLRRTLTQDVLELVQLEERIVDSGIQEICKRSTVSWPVFFSGAEYLRLVPLDPITWLGDEWVHVADASLHRGATVEIFLPDPSATTTAILADRLGRAEVPFASELRRILRQVESDCKALHSRDSTSRFTIYTYEGAVAYGLAMADERMTLSIPRMLDVPGAGQIIALRFGPGEDGLVTTWISAQLDSMSNAGTYFT